MINTAGISIDTDTDKVRDELNRLRELLLMDHVPAYYVRKEGNRVFIEVYPQIERRSFPLND